MFALLFSLMGIGVAGAAAGSVGGGGSSSDKTEQQVEKNHKHAVLEVENAASGKHDDAHKLADEHVHDDDHDHEMPEEHAHDDDHDHEMADEHAHDDDHDHEMADEHAHDDDHDHEMADEHAHDDDHDHEMPEEHAHDDDHDHEMPDEHAHDDDHGGHDTPIVLPTNAAEIEAFVAAVRASPEMHSHAEGSSKMSEHMAAMELTPRDEATHIAIANGAWDDPANWYMGRVPDNDARVLVPDGVHMTYGHVSDARLFTLRVDGALEFATDADSQMVVDTIVISPSGELTIGTAENPIGADSSVDIIFANNGPINTDWDPMLLSRGMIAHGTVEIHGTEKDSHEKVVTDPMAGDNWIDFGETPGGWAVGDTIVIAGTRYDGHYSKNIGPDGPASEDEVRQITEIADGIVFFDEPLVFDHDTPRPDLKTSVANYTRNVSFETENAETAEIFERGHVMFMHNDDVDVRYAEFHELGRTDKSEPARNVDEFAQIEADSNVKGRYSFHFHRAGVDDLEDPGISIGNAVFGSPGWGFVHHDSNAIFDNNATFDTFGAGYVAESGNETGAWTDNIAIFAQGASWKTPKSGNDIANFDLGQTGDGFWFQGRMVEANDNIAASVNHGFVYFHRGGVGESANIIFDADSSGVGELLFNDPDVLPWDFPILNFDDNEAFAAAKGMWVLKGEPNQGHDVNSVIEDFTAWNVVVGVGLEYTSHYTLKGLDLVGNEPSAENTDGYVGILFGGNLSDMTFVDTEVENFEIGAYLAKNFIDPDVPAEKHQYTFIDSSFTNVETQYDQFDPQLDTIIFSENLPHLTPDIELDGPLTYDAASRSIALTGTKTDTLGETDFPGGTDNYTVKASQVDQLLAEEGYYSTTDGQNYFMMDIYFSDRVTGDIYYETHPVMLGGATPQEHGYSEVPFMGIKDLGGQDDLTVDSAELWATLTEGQLVLEEDLPEPEEHDGEMREEEEEVF